MARILVIDDSQAVCTAVRAALALDGHLVEELRLFTDLARYMRERPPDLVLLDLDMPTLPGLDFGRFIRKFEKVRTCILIHSSRPFEDLQKVAQQLGADDVVRKGPMADLRCKVKQLLRHAARQPAPMQAAALKTGSGRHG